MLCIEKIVSRGAAGAELEALSVARLFGIPTGGSTRIFRCSRAMSVVRRYGLSADRCSRRQALLRNIRQADGTLVFGAFGAALEALLVVEGTRYCVILRPDGAKPLRREAALRVLDWMLRYGIRTLNIIGDSGADRAFAARVILLEVLQILGRRPRFPVSAGVEVRGAVVIGGEDACYAVTPWPAQSAWRWREPAGEWQSIADWKEIAVLRESNRLVTWVTERFWKRVPSQIRQWVTCLLPKTRPFEVEQSLHDLGLMELIGRLGKPAEELARAERWAILRLASHAGWDGWEARVVIPDWEAVTVMLARRQRDIAGSFGFPATESVAKILAKVPRESCSLNALVELREIMSDSANRAVLQSLPRVNRTVIHVLSDAWLRRVVGRRLLFEIALRPSEDTCGLRVNGIGFLLFCLQGEADRTGELDRVQPIHSVGAIRRVLRALENRGDSGWMPPASALPGITGVIEALPDSGSLSVEGHSMGHCARQYAGEVRLGHCLMFRVLSNATFGTTRATLQLRPGSDGIWRISQFAGPANAPVDAETARFVKVWLFFAQCDPAASESELSRACRLEMGKRNA